MSKAAVFVEFKSPLSSNCSVTVRLSQISAYWANEQDPHKTNMVVGSQTILVGESRGGVDRIIKEATAWGGDLDSTLEAGRLIRIKQWFESLRHLPTAADVEKLENLLEDVEAE